MAGHRSLLIWAGLGAIAGIPIAAAGLSPLLAWRDPIYIVAGFAGVAAMVLLLVQPLLAAGYLPGIEGPLGRRFHRWVGAALLITVLIHVGGLWITSPPDVIDALLFVSPTPFSLWGVIAMWCLFATGALALFRRRWRMRATHWRKAHFSLAVLIVAGSVLHALLIDGTMEVVSKAVLCLAVALATVKVIADRWPRKSK